MPNNIVVHQTHESISIESIQGLSSQEVLNSHKQYGLNTIQTKNTNILKIFFRQITGNPLIFILIAATIASYFLGQHISSYYIIGMILVSLILGFWNEYSAEKTVEDLLKKISPSTVVIRDGEKQEVPVQTITINDVVLLSPGSIVPADLELIKSESLEIDESSLTGESKPVNKSVLIEGQSPTCFMGTVVSNGSGIGKVVQIGKRTQFGKIAEVTSFVKPTTEFQKGLQKYGELIIKVTVILTVLIFLINSIIGHSWISSLLFALAIAVGLTPELLPIIVTISLSHGAGRLSKKHVIAKQLISIENLGNMDVLCTDKTGTLTEGQIQLVDYVDQHHRQKPSLLRDGLICNTAIFHHKITGNSIDVAIWEHALKHKLTHTIPKKLEEEPFDYEKKAMFCVIEEGQTLRLIAKGAPESIFPRLKHHQESYKTQYHELSKDGFRIVAIASKSIDKQQSYDWDDAQDLEFEGFLSFLDIPKKSAKQAIEKLQQLNVLTKVVTGDSGIVTRKICKEIGLEFHRIKNGEEIEKLTDHELRQIVNEIDIFARVSPAQKLRIIQALRANGHTVGYMGDGINDGPSLHSADVGISVNTAVDVAKDAASIVLLRKSLDVLADGIMEGRKTFNNTIKYILMSTSSNFGNMFSAAGASFFLSFLPMTPVQILLNNGLYDLSQMAIPSDNVDPEALIKPRHWDISFIKKYMIFFGPLSSLFDFLTFGVMLWVFHASSAMFQTGWFLESLATQVLVVFVIRTARTPFFRSKPGKLLIITCVAVVVTAMLLPLTPLAGSIGFVMLPPQYFAILIVLTLLYLVIVELVKDRFLKKFE